MALLGTINCFLIPRDEYKDRMFTTGPVRLPGVPNIEGYDYSAVIAKARSLPELKDESGDYELTTGFSNLGHPLSEGQDQAARPGRQDQEVLPCRWV